MYGRGRVVQGVALIKITMTMHTTRIAGIDMESGVQVGSFSASPATTTASVSKQEYRIVAKGQTAIGPIFAFPERRQRKAPLALVGGRTALQDDETCRYLTMSGGRIPGGW